ncbi:MAG: alpha/beta fold hydrolase [Pseudomonadota bacterium]
MAGHRVTWAKRAVLVVGLVLGVLAVIQLERARIGVERVGFAAGTTPATLYQTAGDGPVVVIAHGFAGSRQLMEAFSLTLARAGYRVAAFDFEGHGRNPVPMSGDVNAIEGTTARLVAETQRVVEAAREMTGYAGPVALLGHSMASDVVVRTALSEGDVAAVVAVSMFSQAVTAEEPDGLLAISGQWEPQLRGFALEAVGEVQAGAVEGETVTNGTVTRRAVVAPFVEHVGVLYSPVSLRETRDWLAERLPVRAPEAPVATIGPWISLLMVATVLLTWPLAGLLGPRQAPVAAVPRGMFWAVLAVPVVVAPAVATQVQLDLLPVMVADTLAVMLAIYGALQLIALRALGIRFGPLDWRAVALLLGWGLLVFGLALDRYAASFVPIPDRLPIIAALAVGTLPFMLADALITQGGQAALWRRVAARVAVFVALGIAVWLDPERLFFLVIIFPVLILFFVVHGLMGRWVGQHGGALAAGLGLGLILAWALGVSFPMFDAV